MQPLANALPTTLAIPTLSANQNVWSTQNVPETKLVSIRNAKIPALGFVALTPIAQQPITMPFANVNLDTLAMLLLHVKGSPQVSFRLYESRFFTL